MSFLSCSGPVKKDLKTKLLCKRLQPGDIALIAHKNLDELAALELVEKKVRAVLNTESILNGEYPAKGASVLLREDILILDKVEQDIFSRAREGERLTIKGNAIFVQKHFVGRGRIIKKEFIQEKMFLAEKNLKQQLDLFVQNTLEYARKEKDLILGQLEFPSLETPIAGKHVLIVIRGHNYKKDLRTIRAYLKEVKPVIIGVDGGGDAVCELGFKPHIILGDMDSVEDQTLKKAGELLVHAYPNGTAPGMPRITKLGLRAKIIAAPGTSEDIAFLLASEKKAKLIVAVGSHSHMLDFLEKGRKGMASTFLVRLKVGDKLVDAKGLAHLYRGGLRWLDLSVLLAAALFPILILAFFSPLARHFLYLLFLRFGISVAGG